MGIGDVWDWICEKFGEGFEEFIDLFRGMFSNLGELSYPGLIAGLVLCLLFFLIRDSPLGKLIQTQGLFMIIVCYVVVFLTGYLMMKAAFERG